MYFTREEYTDSELTKKITLDMTDNDIIYV